MYIVIGASGFIGRYCIKSILEKTNETVIATHFHPLTYTGPDSPRVKWRHIDLSCLSGPDDVCSLGPVDSSTKIIFLAMLSKPDEIFENVSHAWDTNVVSIARAVNAFCDAGCLYYVSTDQVYGESRNGRRFMESDRYHILNSYGQHNMLAEQLVLARGFNVIRLSLVFGPSLDPWRPSFFDNIKSDLEGGHVLEAFMDSYRSTISPDQVSDYLVRLVESQTAHEEKIVNIGSDDILSKYDLALQVAHKYGLNDGLVRPISVKDHNNIFKYAKRADALLLDNTLLKKMLHLDSIHLEL